MTSAAIPRTVLVSDQVEVLHDALQVLPVNSAYHGSEGAPTERLCGKPRTSSGSWSCAFCGRFGEALEDLCYPPRPLLPTESSRDAFALPGRERRRLS